MRRDIGARQRVGMRRLLDGRSVAELASAIVPVVVGVVLAFAWNTAGPYRSTAPTPDPGLSPGVEVTAEQAAAQAWARVTAAAVTGNSPRSSDHDTRVSAGSPSPGSTGCDRATSPQPTRAVGVPSVRSRGVPLDVLLMLQPGQRGQSARSAASYCPARWQPGRATDRESAVLPSITAWPAQMPAGRGVGEHLRPRHAQ
jgi:hypothetical protein